MIERGARALMAAKDLNWDLVKDDWRVEVRRQAEICLTAALTPPPPEPVP